LIAYDSAPLLGRRLWWLGRLVLAMSGAELFMLVVSVVLFGYLLYALLRGERL
jgi:K+-transporting ATPase KdpF subunit